MREPRMTGSGRTPCENETEGVDWFLCERSGLAPIVVRLRAPCIGSLVHESSLHRIVGAPPCIGSLVRAPCIGSLVHESIVTRAAVHFRDHCRDIRVPGVQVCSRSPSVLRRLPATLPCCRPARACGRARIIDAHGTRYSHGTLSCHTYCT
jgi:hypothetical protein